jgi:transposase
VAGTRAPELASRNFAIDDRVQPGPENTNCNYSNALERVGEDVAEKLGYRPNVVTVERHMRGKWICTHSETRVHARVTPHIIDKGILE